MKIILSGITLLGRSNISFDELSLIIAILILQSFLLPFQLIGLVAQELPISYSDFLKHPSVYKDAEIKDSIAFWVGIRASL